MNKILIHFSLILLCFLACERDSNYYFDKGMNNFNQGNYDYAAEQFLNSAKKSYEPTNSLYWAGRSYYEKAKFEEAIKYFNTAIKFDSLNAEYRYYRSMVLWKWEAPLDLGGAEKQFLDRPTTTFLPESIESISKAIELNPKPLYIKQRAKVKCDIGDHIGAIQDLKKLISIDSTYSDQLIIFADSIINHANWNDREEKRKSVEYLNAAIQLSPKNDSLYYKRSIYGSSPLEDINTAIQLKAENSNYYVRRAQIRMQLGNEKNDNDRLSRAYLRAGKSPIHKDNYYQALDDLQQAIALDKENGEAYYLLGVTKLELNDKTGCKDLSKSGELGFKKAYGEIKINC